jgi:23S rRNA (pseudouridine1915-N3)-methyltransferase
MNLIIVAVDKLREPFYKAGVEEYLTRIRRFLPVEQVEVPVGTGEESNGKGHGAILREAASIDKHLGREGRIVTLEITGKPMSTDDFSEWLQGAMNASVPRISFVIGGAWGLAPAVSQKADLRLSLSAMTFPHELARLMLAEQIYRALSLWKGLPYHKK